MPYGTCLYSYYQSGMLLLTKLILPSGKKDVKSYFLICCMPVLRWGLTTLSDGGLNPHFWSWGHCFNHQTLPRSLISGRIIQNLSSSRPPLCLTMPKCRWLCFKQPALAVHVRLSISPLLSVLFVYLRKITFFFSLSWYYFMRAKYSIHSREVWK